MGNVVKKEHTLMLNLYQKILANLTRRNISRKIMFKREGTKVFIMLSLHKADHVGLKLEWHHTDIFFFKPYLNF